MAHVVDSDSFADQRQLESCGYCFYCCPLCFPFPIIAVSHEISSMHLLCGMIFCNDHTKICRYHHSFC